MKKNILINGITIGEGSILPILLRAEYWQSKGDKITIFGSKKLREEIKNYKRISNYRFIELKNCRSVTTKFQFIYVALERNFKALSNINKIKEKYHVIHSISSMLDFIIFPYILKIFDRKIKWVTVFDNIVPLSDPGNKILRLFAWLFFQLSLVLLKKADAIFVISEDLRDFLRERGFNSDKIIVSGNGIDVDLMKRARINKKLNIDALFVGRVNETKGIYDMLRALKIIVKKYPNFQFAVMGKGDKDSEDRFKKEIDNNNLVNNVKFLGYKNGLEKFNIIKSSKCFWFLSVSDSESFGIALLEAVTLGVPAIVYNLIPFRKTYRDNEIFMFKKNDYKSVAKKTLEIFGNRKFENKEGEKLMDKFGWKRIAEIEHNVFTQLLASGRQE